MDRGGAGHCPGVFRRRVLLCARKLHLDLGIPIGVIKSAWGGKPVETFTSREALNTLPGTKALVDATVKADAEFDPAKAKAACMKRSSRSGRRPLPRQKRNSPTNPEGCPKNHSHPSARWISKANLACSSTR